MPTGPQRDAVTFFLDRSIGKAQLAERIRQAGHQVEIHDDHLPRDAPDEAWLELCGERGWVALTIDRLRDRPNERAAVRDGSARVLIVRAGRRSGTEIGDLVIRKLRSIEAFCAAHAPPFLAVLSSRGLRTVRLPRGPGRVAE